ncbi:hypothetical protein DN53_16100 [Flagellimonas olearia]|uniref:Uncharacterized protein n=1 Tax=Flagellimonas olearia TaxID=552546 RepID=A0A444VK89_9FLAO|nr:hypothetical protein DN53_16100 [Allomuricauda olearia]
MHININANFKLFIIAVFKVMAQMNRTDVAEVSHKIQNCLCIDFQIITIKKEWFCKDWAKKQTF